MVSLILGFIFVAFTVFACLPNGLAWGVEIIAFLKGFASVFTAFVGLVAIFIGIADIKDKKKTKREEEAALKAQEEK